MCMCICNVLLCCQKYSNLEFVCVGMDMLDFVSSFILCKVESIPVSAVTKLTCNPISHSAQQVFVDLDYVATFAGSLQAITTMRAGAALAAESEGIDTSNIANVSIRWNPLGTAIEFVGGSIEMSQVRVAGTTCTPDTRSPLSHVALRTTVSLTVCLVFFLPSHPSSRFSAQCRTKACPSLAPEVSHRWLRR